MPSSFCVRNRSSHPCLLLHSTHPKPQQLYGGDATIPRPRRWVLQLQERADFFDKIRKRRHRIGDGDDGDDEQWISHQYHGVVESNASKCIVLGVSQPSETAGAMMSSIPSSQTLTPTHSRISYLRPALQIRLLIHGRGRKFH